MGKPLILTTIFKKINLIHSCFSMNNLRTLTAIKLLVWHALVRMRISLLKILKMEDKSYQK